MPPQMIVQKYLVSKEFSRYFSDWLVCFVLALGFIFIGERMKPFLREFLLNDPSIQHPFAYHERVTTLACGLIAVFVPTSTIVAMVVVMHGNNFFRNRDRFMYHLHLINLSFLGLFLSLCLNAAVTDLLKNWISRPRPDFIARCGPKIPSDGTDGRYDMSKNFNLSICTAPMGEAVLLEGLRSCPSGHSSTAFSGLLYLSLWLAGQLKAFKPGVPVWKLLVCCAPVTLAVYIALSRTQDYRHHFGDILLGGTIGSTAALILYFKFFHSIFNFEKCHLPHDRGSNDDDTIVSEGALSGGYLPV